jgi:hypothetical protein
MWLNASGRANRLKQFEKLLRMFPFSQREQGQSAVSILAVSTAEPPLLERAMNGPVDVAEILPVFSEYAGDDVAYQVDSWWDLWSFDGDWELAPAPVLLSCFMADFDNGTEAETDQQEDLRIDFGVDSRFLPALELPAGGRMIESNIRSLLRLVHEIESVLPVSRRLLETESGENFAERLQGALEATARVQ